MDKVVVDSPAARILREVRAEAEIVDEYGLLLGVFTPVENKELYRRVEIPYTTEELKRLAEQEGGRTLKEILADLEKRQ
jgi:hypothetical protein